MGNSEGEWDVKDQNNGKGKFEPQLEFPHVRRVQANKPSEWGVWNFMEQHNLCYVDIFGMA